MGLYRLIYWSVATEPVNLADIRKIDAVANTANPAHGLTGMLVCSRDRFLQLIEGESLPVNRLYRNLMRDSRHDLLHLTEYVPIAERQFEDWDMAMGHLSELPHHREVLGRLTGSPEFDPATLSGPEVVRLFGELRRTLRTADGTLAEALT